MSKSILVKRVVGRGAMSDVTVGKLYHVFKETRPGEVCPDGYLNNVEPPVVGLSFIDDVGDIVTLREVGDPQADAWELVTE